MKKTVCLILCFVLTFSLFACGEENTSADPASVSEQNPVSAPPTVKYDVDLTKLSSTMVYSEVYNMMTNPGDYLGKKIRMTGSFSVYTDGSTGKNYFACLIADATACCSQGIEFQLSDGRIYPDDYPEMGEIITVSGTFDVYTENGYQYCQLIGAVLE